MYEPSRSGLESGIELVVVIQYIMRERVGAREHCSHGDHEKRRKIAAEKEKEKHCAVYANKMPRDNGSRLSRRH